MPATTVSDKFLSSAPLWAGAVGSGGVPDASVTTVPLASPTGLEDGQVYVFSVDRVDLNKVKTPTKREVCIGKLSGDNLIDCVRGVEGTAQEHSAGAVVEILFTHTHWKKLVEGLEVGHNQDGTHKSGLTFTTPTLTNPTVTTGTFTSPTIITPTIQGWHGWQQDTATWTRTGNHTFTVAGDRTLEFRKGTKIRYKDGGAFEYGVVASSSYSAPNTTVTLITNTNFAMAATTITDTWVSYIENPEGFPFWFNYTPTWGAIAPMTISGVTVQFAKWSVVGTQITFHSWAEFTLGGTPHHTVTCTLPVVPITGATECWSGSGWAVWHAITVYFGNVLSIIRPDLSNYTTGANKYSRITATYQF